MQTDKKVITIAFSLGLFVCGSTILLQSQVARPIIPSNFIPNFLGIETIICLVCFGLGCARIIARYNLTENELQTTSEILNSSEKMAHMGSWRFDIADNNLTWSDEVYQIFGINKEGFNTTYESFLEFVHPEDRNQVNNAYTLALQNNVPYQVTHRIVRPSGEVRVVLEKSENILDPDNNPIRSFGIVQDITEAYHQETEKAELIDKLQQSLKEVKILQGILPICLLCRKIRSDEGYWGEVEDYVKQHSELELMDTICPSCVKQHSPPKQML